jgi:hypothetical protein
MSAVLNNVKPLREQPTLDQLVELYITAKKAEDTANKARVDLETQIIALAGAKEEGATTVATASGMKVTTTGKLSYKVDDIEALRNICAKWDASLVPLKTTTAADETGLKYLRAERPELWSQIARVVTIKPAKTSVKVGV